MKTSSPRAFALALFLSLIISIPADLWAAPPDTPARAGEVSRVIPQVSIARGAKTITASPKSVVDWLDVVNSQANARARIALDDGSVLNVGSESSLKVIKHDAGAQQTELELTYGKMRSQAQKITKPDGKFEVRTPAGVAGVVGTDHYTAYDPGTGTMTEIVFEGIVKVCSLNNTVCVMVKAGQMTNVRNDNNPPQAPSQASLETLTEASNGTFLGVQPQSGGTETGHVWTRGNTILTIVTIAVPAVAIGVMASRGGTGTTTSTSGNSPGCSPGGITSPGCPP